MREIHTTLGPVTGFETGPEGDRVAAYLGIPYAASPTGDLRFAPPAPHAGWTVPFVATAFGATAPQAEHASPGGLPDVPEPIIRGDDFLNLNVWTTASEGDAPRPVLVWIHGGGFFAGNSANPWYDGASFARHGLVVVSLNYRLGSEGFLVAPGIAPNLALLDWIAALEWVRDNVAAFGGDPSQVTVMGQSAGGMALSALLVTPSAHDLFARAIIASGIARTGTLTLSEAEEVGRAILERAGTTDDLAGARTVSPSTFVDVHAALAAEADRNDQPLRLSWGPVIDGELISAGLFDAVPAGMGGDIPVLVGSTKNEFAWRTIIDDPDGTGPDFEQKRLSGQHLFADELFRRPTDDFARARVAAGAAPTYRYEFQWRSTASPYIGAGHSLDIPFFFNNLDAPYFEGYAGPDAPQALADVVHGAFANFALTGDPGWPAFDADAESVMIFDTDSRVERGVQFED